MKKNNNKTNKSPSQPSKEKTQSNNNNKNTKKQQKQQPKCNNFVVDLQGGSLSLISRVHPKNKGGRDQGGHALRVPVDGRELLGDLCRGMPYHFLIPKYRLPQKNPQVKIVWDERRGRGLKKKKNLANSLHPIRK